MGRVQHSARQSKPNSGHVRQRRWNLLHGNAADGELGPQLVALRLTVRVAGVNESAIAGRGVRRRSCQSCGEISHVPSETRGQVYILFRLVGENKFRSREK